jgi:Domain of unknown function (DUF6531)
MPIAPTGPHAKSRVEQRKMPKPAHRNTLTVQGATKVATAKPLIRTSTAPPAAPFTECPAVGPDTSCGDLIQLTDSGIAVIADPTQGPYDGADDTLVGVVNNSSEAVGALAIETDTDAFGFGFDGDGICSGVVTPSPGGCPFGSTGYEGPGTSFTGITADKTSGTLAFAAPLAPGASAYFSLEEALAANQIFGSGPSVDEQGGAPNPSEQITSCSTCQPVNEATGEFWHTFTDVSIPGRGVPPDLTRTYTSAAAAKDGPFGFGRSTSYGMSLSVTPRSLVVTVHQENGSTVTFHPNGSGGLVAVGRSWFPML